MKETDQEVEAIVWNAIVQDGDDEVQVWIRKNDKVQARTYGDGEVQVVVVMNGEV